MKLYSYLHSGKAVLATNLPTHTQLLDDGVAMLAEPNPGSYSKGMLQLVADATLRTRLGSAGKELIEERHTFPVFREDLNTLYDSLSARIIGSVPA
jgi:glycosyltransferase involved in cell wall biosynthesis